jgi:hypothetical protein
VSKYHSAVRPGPVRSFETVSAVSSCLGIRSQYTRKSHGRLTASTVCEAQNGVVNRNVNTVSSLVGS